MAPRLFLPDQAERVPISLQRARRAECIASLLQHPMEEIV